MISVTYYAPSGKYRAADLIPPEGDITGWIKGVLVPAHRMLIANMPSRLFAEKPSFDQFKRDAFSAWHKVVGA